MNDKSIKKSIKLGRYLERCKIDTLWFAVTVNDVQLTIESFAKRLIDENLIDDFIAESETYGFNYAVVKYKTKI